jgi:small GTP-binding protein
MNSSEKKEMIYKILTLGDTGVGKTNILLQFTEKKFNKAHLSTIGIDFKAKNIEVFGQPVKLKVWDTAGQERFRQITQQYYKGADGIVLVYDVTEKETFDQVSEWIEEIYKHTNQDRIGIVLVANKIDLEPKKVSTEEGSQLASKYKMKFFETSALLNKNIDESFHALTEEIMTKRGVEVDKLKETFEINRVPARNEKNEKKKCCK